MKSLETLERFMVEGNVRGQNEGLPNSNISTPYFTETLNSKYEIDGPVILTYSSFTLAQRFGIFLYFLQKWAIHLSANFDTLLNHSTHPKTNKDNQGESPNSKLLIAEMTSRYSTLWYPCISYSIKLEINVLLPFLMSHPPPPPQMNEHIITTLASLHTCLNRLENQAHLAGKEITRPTLKRPCLGIQSVVNQ
jgi:hypothetical protein